MQYCFHRVLIHKISKHYKCVDFQSLKLKKLIYASLLSTRSLFLFGLRIKMLQLNTVQTCTP